MSTPDGRVLATPAELWSVELMHPGASEADSRLRSGAFRIPSLEFEESARLQELEDAMGLPRSPGSMDAYRVPMTDVLPREAVAGANVWIPASFLVRRAVRLVGQSMSETLFHPEPLVLASERSGTLGSARVDLSPQQCNWLAAAGHLYRRAVFGGALGFGPVAEEVRVRGVWFTAGTDSLLVAGNVY